MISTERLLDRFSKSEYGIGLTASFIAGEATTFRYAQAFLQNATSNPDLAASYALITAGALVTATITGFVGGFRIYRNLYANKPPLKTRPS